MFHAEVIRMVVDCVLSLVNMVEGKITILKREWR